MGTKTLVFIGGSFTAIMYLAIGISSLVVRSQHMTPQCSDGHPPLREWLLGTGIAYTIIGASFFLWTFFFMLRPIFLWVLKASGTFLFAWMIVGSVSLWRDGGNCKVANFPLWQVGMAAVIMSIIIFACFGFSIIIIKNESDNPTDD